MCDRREFVLRWSRPLWMWLPEMLPLVLNEVPQSFVIEPMKTQVCYGTVYPVGMIGLHDLVRRAA